MTLLEKKLRSPLTSATLILLTGGLVEAMTFPEIFPAWLAGWIARITLFLIAGWVILVAYHNWRHPDRKIRIWSYLPLEFREEDEGLQWVTYRACRNVCVYLYFAAPAALIAMALSSRIPYLPVPIVTLLGVGQCLVYWWEWRKWDDAR